MALGVRGELLQGTLDLLILRLLQPGALHGYAIAQRMRLLSRDALQVRQGSLYPALHRLEQRRWLKAEWRASETGREAKFYSLTPAGRRQLRREQEGWEQLTEAIASILRAQA